MRFKCKFQPGDYVNFNFYTPAKNRAVEIPFKEPINPIYNQKPVWSILCYSYQRKLVYRFYVSTDATGVVIQYNKLQQNYVVEFDNVVPGTPKIRIECRARDLERSPIINI